MKAAESDIYICASYREIHITLSDELSDVEWRDFIRSIKADFARFGAEKSKVVAGLERFVLFQNKFAALAEICAELHERIVDTPPLESSVLRATSKAKMNAHFEAQRRNGERATRLYGACVQLSLLTPVLAEAFLNMFVLVLCRRAFFTDQPQYENYRRSKITDRLASLHEVCDGMLGPVDRTSENYRDFLRVMNKRNFAIHGNVDPEREALETVFFEGTRPIFATPGNHITRFFEALERLHRPEVVIEDYVAVHAFLHELKFSLSSRHRHFFEQVIGDAYPGFEVNKKRTTRVLPDRLVMSVLGGVRYDDELRVDW